jgi:lysophospholipase L1-like esterase
MPRLLGDLRSHLETIFSRLRDDAGYAGPIVALTYYAPNYGNLTEDASLIALNQVLADVARDWDAKVANGFDAFLRASLAQTGDACAAGLLVSMPGGGCDAHPSLDGHRALAQTVAQVLGPVGPRAN